MARFFDIMPPKPKPAPPAPRRRKNGWGWFLIGIILLVALGIGAQLPSNTPKTTTQNKPTLSTDSAQTQFELFNNTGESNLTPEKALIVRILDASGGDSLAQKAKKLLTDAGLTVEQVGTSANLYEQTIVYYKKDKIAQGQKIENILKTAFQMKVSESESLGTTYDVLVIVGQK